MSIHVGEWVLHLTQRAEHTWDSLIAHSHQLNDFVVLDVLLSELLEVQESGICVSEDGMAISWDNSAGLESLVDKLNYGVLVGSLSVVEFLCYNTAVP